MTPLSVFGPDHGLGKTWHLTKIAIPHSYPTLAECKDLFDFYDNALKYAEDLVCREIFEGISPNGIEFEKLTDLAWVPPKSNRQANHKRKHNN